MTNGIRGWLGQMEFIHCYKPIILKCELIRQITINWLITTSKMSTTRNSYKVSSYSVVKEQKTLECNDHEHSTSIGRNKESVDTERIEIL